MKSRKTIFSNLSPHDFIKSCNDANPCNLIDLKAYFMKRRNYFNFDELIKFLDIFIKAAEGSTDADFTRLDYLYKNTYTELKSLVNIKRINNSEYEYLYKTPEEIVFGAYEKEHYPIIALFLENGFDINNHLDIKDTGNTLLIEAVLDGNRDYVLFLLKNGAKINLSNYNGRTPIMEAVLNDDYEMVKLLIRHDADIYLEDIIGHTATDFSQSDEITDLLLGYEHKGVPFNYKE
jgi:hypothetical protein